MRTTCNLHKVVQLCAKGGEIWGKGKERSEGEEGRGERGERGNEGKRGERRGEREIVIISSFIVSPMR